MDAVSNSTVGFHNRLTSLSEHDSHLACDWYAPSVQYERCFEMF